MNTNKYRFLEIFSAFCAGVSWVSAFIFAIFVSQYLFHFGFFVAVVGFIISLVFGFVFVAIFEILSLLLSLSSTMKHENTSTLSDN